MIIGLQWVEEPTLYKHLLPEQFSWDHQYPLPRIGEYLVIELGPGERLSVRVEDIAYIVRSPSPGPPSLILRPPSLGVRFVNYTPPITERTTK